MEQNEDKSMLAIWTLAARPKTLWAAVAPVLMGTALAVEAGHFHWVSASVALLCAVLIQIGTNYSNDYYDFIKGADTFERKGPMRVTQAGLVSPRATRLAAMLVFTFAFLSGLYLVWRGGWPILIIGLLSILFGILYTAGRYSLAYLGLGDLFVLIFFGPVAVGGTFYVQALYIDTNIVLLGLTPGLLSMAILLVNNIRDIDEDRKAGKRTLVVRLGRNFGIGLYVTSIVVSVLIPAVIYLSTSSHPWILSTLVILPLSIPIVKTLIQQRDAAHLNPMLGATSRLLLVYSVVFSFTWNI